MQAIRVRAWVEVVGSVMKNSFQSSMKCQKFSGTTLREKRKARCPRMNSLAKYLALQYIRRYIAEFNEIECCSSQYSGKIGSHWPWSELRRVGSSHDKAVALAACRQPRGCRESRTSGRRGKTPWGKPVSAINTVRKSQAASRWGPWKIPPLYRIWRIPTTYSCSNTSSWPMSRLLLCCAWMP